MSFQFASLKKWQELVIRDQSATFFQTPFWLTSLAKARNLRYHAQSKPWFYPQYDAQAMLWEKDGVTCALPMLRIQYPWGSYFENPLGTYGGPISSENGLPPSSPHLESLFKRHSFHFTQSPYRPWSFGLGKTQTDRTFVIECQTPEGWPIEKYWKKTRKEELRKGLRHGYAVRLVAPGIKGNDDAEAFLNLYQEQILSWGLRARTVHSPELLGILKNDVPEQHYRLFMVENQQGLAASMLAFEFNGRLHAWCCASTDESKLKGVHAVMHHGVLSYARSRGLATYDLNPSGSLPGVEAFKISLGARPIPIQRYHQFNGTFRAIQGLARLKRFLTV